MSGLSWVGADVLCLCAKKLLKNFRNIRSQLYFDEDCISKTGRMSDQITGSDNGIARRMRVLEITNNLNTFRTRFLTSALPDAQRKRSFSRQVQMS